MSISTMDKAKLWMLSGGRCEYPGCNDALWRDNLTFNELNTSYMAHIIARNPEGPRGDEKLSEKLADEISNIMLLCDTHHRMIDNANDNGVPPEVHHPVKKLREFKKGHEQRIEQLTSLERNRRSYILSFTAQIERHIGRVSLSDAKQAMLPDRYPATDQIIKIDLTQNELTEMIQNFGLPVQQQ